MATQAVLALFSNAQKAANATDLIKGLGIKDDQWDVLSGVPYPEGAFGERMKRIRLYVFPFIGAALGLSVALLLTAGTQISYPLVTGGKPILSLPPMALITYEGTMLGAILFTIIGILFESRLPATKLGLYDKRITEGFIGILVRCPAELLTGVQQVLRQAGADDVKVEGQG